MAYIDLDDNLKQKLAPVISELSEDCDITLLNAHRLPHDNELLKKAIAIGQTLESREIFRLAVQDGVRNIIQDPNINLLRHVAFTTKILQETESFFENPQTYLYGPNSSALINEPIEAHTYQLKNVEDKDKALGHLKTDLQSVPRSGRIQESALTIASEMALNVIYNAPKYDTRDMADHNERPAGQLFCAYNNNTLLLGCEDDYGSLDIEKALYRLKETFQSDKVQVNTDPQSGAGLGCRMMFDLSSSLFMFLKPGQKTVFTTLLPLGMSHRRQQSLPKNLSVFDACHQEAASYNNASAATG